MNGLATVVRAVGALNTLIGRLFAWLSLGIVLVCFAVVVLRYGFAITFIWMQDLYVWLNGAMFTAVAGYALLRDDHVRVDIFYRPASPRRKAVIDLIGVVLFLLPFMVLIWLYAWPFVTRSWSYHEGSAQVGGMPGLYILKSFILGFATLVGLQGIAMICRSILVLADCEALLPENLRYPRRSAAEVAH